MFDGSVCQDSLSFFFPTSPCPAFIPARSGRSPCTLRKPLVLSLNFELSTLNHQPSKITCANAWLSVCVMLSATLFTPICCAIFAASPMIASVGLPLVSRTTSKSTHRTPRRQPVPSAFIAASFAANRPAYRSYLFLNRSQYSRSLVVYTRRRNTSP